MLASGDIPFVFVDRLAGLQLLGVAGVTDDERLHHATTRGRSDRRRHDHRGRVRRLGLRAAVRHGHPQASRAGRVDQRRSTPTPCPSPRTPRTPRASATSPCTRSRWTRTKKLAYVSYYAAGSACCEYGRRASRRSARSSTSGGNNFWGVEVWHDETRREVRARQRPRLRPVHPEVHPWRTRTSTIEQQWPAPAGVQSRRQRRPVRGRHAGARVHDRPVARTRRAVVALRHREGWHVGRHPRRWKVGGERHPRRCSLVPARRSHRASDPAPSHRFSPCGALPHGWCPARSGCRGRRLADLPERHRRVHRRPRHGDQQRSRSSGAAPLRRTCSCS